jgi:CheY-like chemotaxis protein
MNTNHGGNPSSTRPASPERRRILVVDDEPVVLNAVRRSLRIGCAVDVAANAEDGLALAMVHKYHAVVTDFDMPGRNGIWLLEQLRERFPETLRVLHSGSDPADVGAHVARGVVQRFIPKPAPAGALARLWA